ncbi:MAG TPA: hypothetical protein VG816_11920 [Solirubrobacterales bacterium]|nr:hypothetical protein [Solirubrobacterales bacterium]
MSERIFDLFTEPTYWPELMTQRPCILEGGRGTGKTTVLRLLAHEGQYALGGRQADTFDQKPFLGFYERIDTNRVRAFAGTEIPESMWIRIFGHYLNLRLVSAVLRFTTWYSSHLGRSELISDELCRSVAYSLNLDVSPNQYDLYKNVRNGLLKLEAEVNNVGEKVPSGLSLQKAPVDVLMEGLSESLPDKDFFFLFDEYENFSPYQQRVVNTFIKHSGTGYTFKVGVREFGLRTRETLNPAEQLTSPADYVKIRISEKFGSAEFADFAAQVCNSRLARLKISDPTAVLEINQILPGLSEEEEAHRLKVDEVLAEPLRRLQPNLTPAQWKAFRDAPALEQLLVIRWAEVHDEPVEKLVIEYLEGSPEWTNRINNYGYALLFTLQRGRGRGGIQKYYSGWDVFTSLAAGNIRYLLELVEQTLLLHLESGGRLAEPVDPSVQTRAAQQVGRKNLTELEGLSVHGARLTKLVLGLGRIFQLLALKPIGHTPEVNEFELIDSDNTSPDVIKDVAELLPFAVSQLALLRKAGTKVSNDPSDTRDFDYRLHPIFSPTFVFSHRQKRKMGISSAELLEVISSPQDAIPALLARRKRSVDEVLPEQLNFFEAYFGTRSQSADSE